MKIIIKTRKNTYTWQPRILINNIKNFILGTSCITIPILGCFLCSFIIEKVGL